jgi:radical SAM superfamily enzyme YgiQ (UPF0313 family)
MMLVPSLAVAIFTRVLKDEGYKVDLFDTTHYVTDETSSPQNRVRYLQARYFREENDLGVRIKTDLLGDFKRKVEDFAPQLILYSVVEDCYRQALALMNAIKDKKIRHIVGGPFPTAAPGVCINYDLVDMVGIGDGEQIIVDVARRLEASERLDDVPGVWIKSGSRIIKNKRGPLTDITRYTPDFSLFDAARFNRPMGGRIFRTIPVETYRGCPFQCTYCNSPMQTIKAKDSGIGNYLRRKLTSTLEKELELLIEKFNPEFFYFIDDSFTARPKQEIFDFCDMYEQFKIPFWFNTRPETTNLEMLRRLKQVGAYRISFGIESGNEDYRQKQLRRKGSNQKLIELFSMVEESGIPFSINLIIGMPGETREMIMDTVHLVRQIGGFDTITVSIFTPYHGTVLRTVAVDKGWLNGNYITTHTTSSSALNMPKPYISSSEIDGLMRSIPLYVYFPESEWESIRRTETNDLEGERILGHYSALYKRNFLGEDQNHDKVFIEGATGCKSNPKDSLSVSL